MVTLYAMPQNTPSGCCLLGISQPSTEIKKSLPGVCFQGVSSEGTREIDTLSGLVICEYDNVDDVYYWLSVIRKNPYVRAAFVSMSGKGLKVIGVASTIPTPETYHLAWYAFSTYFEEIGDVDATGARVNQMNVVAYADRFLRKHQRITFRVE